METTKIVLRYSDVSFKDLEVILKDKSWTIFDDFEAEPINGGFTSRFGNLYWYLQYHILRDGGIDVEFEDLLILLNEKNISFNWINLSSKDSNITIRLIDGINWKIEFDDKLSIELLLKIKP
ncbi:MAG: hypothetical protein HRT66_01625 [Flavobacteriaceae bacterium]|nr:hypothetical protein [Flavobacteriaceae bacterium]